MIGKYKVAHLLGITREHQPQFRHIEQELTKLGYIVFAPAIYNFSVYLDHADMIDDMCYEKLLIADICVVATPEHIGKSTSKRLKQCVELGKPVYTWIDSLELCKMNVIDRNGFINLEFDKDYLDDKIQKFKQKIDSLS